MCFFLFFFSHTRLVFSCRKLSHQNYLVICLILCSQLIFIPRFYLPNFIRLKISNKLKNTFFRTIFLSMFFFQSGNSLGGLWIELFQKRGFLFEVNPSPWIKFVMIFIGNLFHLPRLEIHVFPSIFCKLPGIPSNFYSTFLRFQLIPSTARGRG